MFAKIRIINYIASILLVHFAKRNDFLLFSFYLVVFRVKTFLVIRHIRLQLNQGQVQNQQNHHNKDLEQSC